MANIIPSNIEELRLGGSSELELETLAELKANLGSAYTVFYSSKVSYQDKKKQWHREIDFVVVNASGDVLLIEQKNGALIEYPKDIRIHYRQDSKDKSVIDQMHWARETFLSALQRANIEKKITISSLLYCPDHILQGARPAGLDRRAIVDATQRGQLANVIERLLSSGDPSHGGFKPMARFLSQALSLAPDLGRTLEHAETSFQRLSSALHDVPFNLDFSPWRLHVQAAAGSGKSILAAEVYERAKARGERVLLACFNRPLADLLQQRLGNTEDVNNFHGHCTEWLKRYGSEDAVSQSIDQGSPFWEALVDSMAVIADKAGPYDWLIIDEGQDFKSDWFEVLRLAMKDDFRCLWLEDKDQALMGQGSALPRDEGFVTYTCRENFRTPQKIAEFIDQTLDTDITWRNPLPGLEPVVSHYETPDDQARLLANRIDALKVAGFRPDQIAIVSLCGQTSAMFRDLDRVGDHRIRRFTGQYDVAQSAIYTEGEIAAETIYRFKGQQAPAVILTDVEMLYQEDRSEQENALLWCGLTRPLVACEILARKKT